MFFSPPLSPVKAFLQDLSREHVTVMAFNELCNQLLQDYATDDTRRVKEVMDKTVMSWNSISNRYTHALHDIEHGKLSTRAEHTLLDTFTQHEIKKQYSAWKLSSSTTHKNTRIRRSAAKRQGDHMFFPHINKYIVFSSSPQSTMTVLYTDHTWTKFTVKLKNLYTPPYKATSVNH